MIEYWPKGGSEKGGSYKENTNLTCWSLLGHSKGNCVVDAQFLRLAEYGWKPHRVVLASKE